MTVRLKKRINISLEYFAVWMIDLAVSFFFLNLVQATILSRILVLSFITILCFSNWLFFYLKIDWLKDIHTGKEIYHLNLSNLLSSLRFTLVPMLIIVFGLITAGDESFTKKIIVFVFAFSIGLTDLFDGYFARKFNEVTRLGSILDPVGDFLMITCFTLLVYVKGIISWWFLIFMVIRIPFFLLILIFLVIIRFKIKPQTTILGKLTIFYSLGFLALATFRLFIDQIHPVYDLILIIAQVTGSVILLVSSIEKIRYLIHLIRNQKEMKSDYLNF